MFPHRPISILSILTVILTILLCSPWAAIAQIGEQRLIPLAVTDDGISVAVPTIPSGESRFVVYGRAEPIEDSEVGFKDVGILDDVPPLFYRQIPGESDNAADLARMPDLDTFFGFGGTLELLTPAKNSSGEASTLNKHDLVISEIMWAIDEGIDEDGEDGDGWSTVRKSNYAVD